MTRRSFPGSDRRLLFSGNASARILDGGDATGNAELTEAKTTAAWYWISSIEVMAPVDAGAIVAFGDSITDGTTSMVNADKSWPSLLSERLVANTKTGQLKELIAEIKARNLAGPCCIDWSSR
jgi:hypothetical protein